MEFTHTLKIEYENNVSEDIPVRELADGNMMVCAIPVFGAPIGFGDIIGVKADEGDSKVVYFAEQVKESGWSTVAMIGESGRDEDVANAVAKIERLGAIVARKTDNLLAAAIPPGKMHDISVIIEWATGQGTWRHVPVLIRERLGVEAGIA